MKKKFYSKRKKILNKKINKTRKQNKVNTFNFFLFSFTWRKNISEENVFLPGDILCQSKKTKGPCVKKLLFKKCHKKSVEFYFMCENESTKLLIADRLTFCFCRWWNRRIVKSYYTQISVIIIITLMNSWVNGDEQNECEHVSGVEQLLPPETSEETWREETEISAGHKHNQTVNTTNTKLLRDTERLNNNQV